MTKSNPRPRSRVALRRTPWATLGILILIVGYVALRPSLEQLLGVDLPSILQSAPTQENPDTATSDSPSNRTKNDRPGKHSRITSDAVPLPGSRPTWEGLQEVGQGVKESPAGLRYSPGGAEGHRLEHVLRHGQDQPQRPGRHGVFDGTSDELLATIDEAYRLARSGSPQAQSRREGIRTVYDVDMRRRIGYVGGRTGKQLGHPAATHLRLVLEGNQVITAYPF